MAVFNKYNTFVGDVASAKHQMQTGTAQVYKVYLTSTAPTSTDTSYSTSGEPATANGYTAAGNTVGTITGVQSSGIFSFSGGTNPSWTASGGSIGPFRYAILFNATVAGTPLIGYWDYGTALTLTNGNTFTVTLPSPILTIT